MTAPRVLVEAAKNAAGNMAREKGHRLGPWLHERGWHRATCYVCCARATIDARGSISGPALTAHCKVPETAGRAA